MPPKVQPFASVCNHWFTMASADFSPFVVTDGFHTLFPSADGTFLGTTRHLSRYDHASGSCRPFWLFPLLLLPPDQIEHRAEFQCVETSATHTKAEHMLRNTTKSVAAISDTLGYEIRRPLSAPSKKNYTPLRRSTGAATVTRRLNPFPYETDFLIMILCRMNLHIGIFKLTYRNRL